MVDGTCFPSIEIEELMVQISIDLSAKPNAKCQSSMDASDYYVLEEKHVISLEYFLQKFVIRL